MNDIIAVLRVGQGEVAIRKNCNCGLCRAYRDEPNTVIRTLEENRARVGFTNNRRVLEQQRRDDAGVSR
jgi:hypothetical protein